MSELWGPIDRVKWRETPCVVGRCATESDVASGSAVFHVPSGSVAVNIEIPCCAFQAFDDGYEVPVVVIQAEAIPTGTALGVRPLSGGNGVCLLSEVRILSSGFEAENAG